MTRLAIKSIVFYQKYIRYALGTAGACRFEPSCSEYSLTAIQRYGVLKGAIMSIKRIIKCNPLTQVQHDPVPLK